MSAATSSLGLKCSREVMSKREQTTDIPGGSGRWGTVQEGLVRLFRHFPYVNCVLGLGKSFSKAIFNIYFFL